MAGRRNHGSGYDYQHWWVVSTREGREYTQGTRAAASKRGRIVAGPFRSESDVRRARPGLTYARNPRASSASAIRARASTKAYARGHYVIGYGMGNRVSGAQYVTASQVADRLRRGGKILAGPLKSFHDAFKWFHTYGY